MSILSYISPALLTFAVIIGCLAYYFENCPSSNEAILDRIMATLEESKEQFKTENKSAFVLGSTGEVGKELLKEILNSKLFGRVVLIGRREVKYEEDIYKNIEQKVVDFEKIDEYAADFQSFNIGFCALGSTKNKAGGGEQFYHIDHDYVVNSAKLAKEGGCEQFHLVSSMGANAKSSNIYWKTKGETEEHIKELGFDRFFTYRPGVLMCDRQESRPGEAVFRFFMKPIAKLAPTWMSTPTEVVGKAMVNAAILPTADSFMVMENKDIFKLAEGTAPKKKTTK